MTSASDNIVALARRVIVMELISHVLAALIGCDLFTKVVIFLRDPIVVR